MTILRRQIEDMISMDIICYVRVLPALATASEHPGGCSVFGGLPSRQSVAGLRRSRTSGDHQAIAVLEH